MDKNLMHLLNVFQGRIDMLSHAMAAGNCSNYDEYKFTCGQIRGLMAALDAVEDLMDNLENLDD